MDGSEFGCLYGRSSHRSSDYCPSIQVSIGTCSPFCDDVVGFVAQEIGRILFGLVPNQSRSGA